MVAVGRAAGVYKGAVACRGRGGWHTKLLSLTHVAERAKQAPAAAVGEGEGKSVQALRRIDLRTGQ